MAMDTVSIIRIDKVPISAIRSFVTIANTAAATATAAATVAAAVTNWATLTA